MQGPTEIRSSLSSRRERLGIHVVVTGLVLVASTLSLSGCPNGLGDPQCDQTGILAVADDQSAGGPTYVLRSAGFEEGVPYTLARTDRAAPLASTTDDGTSVGLLAPAAGGVVVVGGGAAAQRFDATGTSPWTVGYAAVGAQAALVAGDRLIVADATTVRAVSPDGAIVWERALDRVTTGVSQVVADRAGGAWVVGAFTGAFPPWVTDVRTDQLSVVGHFILRFDAAGSVVAANAWEDTDDSGLAWRQALAVARGDGSTELVLVGGANPGSGAVPALGIARADGDGPFVVAFDGNGTLLWSHRLEDGAQLQADPDGNLLAMTVTTAGSSSDAGSSGAGGSTSGGGSSLVGGLSTPAGSSMARGLSIERWDANAAPLAETDPAVDTRTMFALETTNDGELAWTSAPTKGGVVVAGQWIAESESGDQGCPQAGFLFRVQTAPLRVTPLPSVKR